MAYQPTTALKKILSLKKRIRAVAGGTSASKTISILMWCIDYAGCHQNQLISVVSQSFPHLSLGAIRDFKAVMKDKGYWNEDAWHETNHTYTFPTGTIIEFFSSDSEKAHGPRRDVLFLNEAQNISLDEADHLMVRTRRIIWMDWNPTNEFWFYTEFLGKRQDVDFITLTYKDNEALEPATVADIESRKTRTGWWRVYGLGLLGEVEGIIYTNWQTIHTLPHEARLERYGIDFGYTNDPTAIVAVYYYNGGYILDEIAFQKGLSNKQIADIILNQPKKALVIADSAEPKSIAEIRMYGVSIQPAVKGRDSVRQSIQAVQAQQISMTARSVNLIKAYKNYMWKTDKDGNILNEPDHLYSDAMDACFAGDTLIETDQGFARIDSLVGKSGVLRSHGEVFKKFSDVRQTRSNAEVLHMYLGDATLTVTPDHLLLNSNGEWVEAGLLRVGDRIQSGMYGSAHDKRDHAGVQWKAILSQAKWLLLQFVQGWHPSAIYASSGMGIPLWGSSTRVPYSSHRRRPGEQSDRELAVRGGRKALIRTHDARETGEATAVGRENTTAYEEVAWLRGGEGMAPDSWGGSLQEETGSRATLCSLWQTLYYHTVNALRTILPSELQDESQTKTVTWITRGLCEKVYNLEVEDTHRLVVAGVVAHNCRYALTSLIPMIQREEFIQNMPRYADAKVRVNPAR